MEQKTKVFAEEGKQDLLITREFDLPLEHLFNAYTKVQFLEQWMGTKVIHLECVPFGKFHFQTSDGQGNVVFEALGVMHEFNPYNKITRTFKMENSPFEVQLEFLDFESISENTSKLTIHTIFKSVEMRNMLLQMPFEFGLNKAHNLLQTINFN